MRWETTRNDRDEGGVVSKGAVACRLGAASGGEGVLEGPTCANVCWSNPGGAPGKRDLVEDGGEQQSKGEVC